MTRDECLEREEKRLCVCIRFVKSKQKPIIETVLIGN